MEVFLFTNFFPYKKAEPFLKTEFDFTRKHASRIGLFTLYGKEKDSFLEQSDKLELFPPVLDEIENKKLLFLRGFFNFSPFNFHLKEFFQKHLFTSPKKLYWLIISLLVTRSALSSKAYKLLLQHISLSQNPVLYFYWGDNLCWMIPYIRQKTGNKVKIVMRMHGSDVYEHLKGDYAPLRDKIFENTDQIFPVSENGKDYLLNKYPAYSHKIKLSRLGVFDNGLNPTKSEHLHQVMSVSNLIPLKRVDLIYESLQKTSGKITWHHFGDGILAKELKELIKSKREGLEVIFHGHVDNRAIINFYRTNHLSLFINLSTTEGLPVAIMEAFSFGIPAIATNVGGTSELVSNSVGRLVKPGINSTEVASIIDEILNADSQSTEQFRINARKIFEEKVSAEKNYEAFYQDLEALSSGGNGS